MPVCLSHHGTRRRGCLGIGHPSVLCSVPCKKKATGTKQNTSPPTSRPHVGRLTRAGRSGSASRRLRRRRSAGPTPTRRRAARAQSNGGWGSAGEARPDDIDLGGKDAIFSWENTTSIATFVSFAALRFLAKKGPSFRLPLHVARCTLPPANRQDRIRSLVGAVTFTSTSASRLTLSSLPPAAARRPANAAKASSRLGKAVGAARHEAALSLKY